MVPLSPPAPPNSNLILCERMKQHARFSSMVRLGVVVVVGVGVVGVYKRDAFRIVR